MSSSERHDVGDPLLEEVVEDPEVTDAQLGALVRQYRGITRPPQVIVVRPNWFEKTVVILGFLLVGVLLAAGVAQYRATLTNRKVGQDFTHVLCDPGRIPEIVNADEKTKEICEANGQ